VIDLLREREKLLLKFERGALTRDEFRRRIRSLCRRSREEHLAQEQLDEAPFTREEKEYLKEFDVFLRARCKWTRFRKDALASRDTRARELSK